MKLLGDIVIQRNNINDESVMIKNIYVENNDKVEEGTLLLDYETSKANFEIHSDTSGFVHILCKEGELIEVGNHIAKIYDSPIVGQNSGSENNDTEFNQSFSKKALDKIAELDIDKSVFNSAKLVTENMVLDYHNNINNQLNDSDKTKLIPNSKLTESSRLTNSDRFGLVSYVSKSFESYAIDCDTIYNEKEFKGSLSIVLIKTMSDLLSADRYKHLNSFIKDSNIIYYDSINFGMAINLGSGLKVGVIHDSANKSVHQIEERVIELIDKYIDDKMELKDIENPSIVLTDLTDQDIDSFLPLIINDNSMMIGLSGRKEGIQKIGISFDHRVTDGLEVSRFINDTISQLEKQFPSIEMRGSCCMCFKNIEEEELKDSPGFIKVLTSKNVEKYVCRNCIDGF